MTDALGTAPSLHRGGLHRPRGPPPASTRTVALRDRALRARADTDTWRRPAARPLRWPPPGEAALRGLGARLRGGLAAARRSRRRGSRPKRCDRTRARPSPQGRETPCCAPAWPPSRRTAPRIGPGSRHPPAQDRWPPDIGRRRRKRVQPHATAVVHLPRMHEVGQALGKRLHLPAERTLLAFDLPWMTTARAKLASSCPAGIDHLSTSLVLCGFGLTWSVRRSTARGWTARVVGPWAPPFANQPCPRRQANGRIHLVKRARNRRSLAR